MFRPGGEYRVAGDHDWAGCRESPSPRVEVNFPEYSVVSPYRCLGAVFYENCGNGDCWGGCRMKPEGPKV